MTVHDPSGIAGRQLRGCVLKIALAAIIILIIVICFFLGRPLLPDFFGVISSVLASLR